MQPARGQRRLALRMSASPPCGQAIKSSEMSQIYWPAFFARQTKAYQLLAGALFIPSLTPKALITVCESLEFAGP